jgi:protein dithiol:quinone oxidoreductase
MMVLLRRLALTRGRLLLSTMSLVALGMVATAIVLTEWLRLNPCHLCIFQRILHMGLAVCFALAALSFGRRGFHRFWVLAGGLIALAGVGVAGFQSWEQWYPELVGGCTGAEPGLIEQLVEWLGIRWPRLFMATGFCENKELVILGLSLANWSFLAYAGFTAMASLILFYPSISRKENAS